MPNTITMMKGTMKTDLSLQQQSSRASTATGGTPWISSLAGVAPPALKWQKVSKKLPHHCVFKGSLSECFDNIGDAWRLAPLIFNFVICNLYTTHFESVRQRGISGPPSVGKKSWTRIHTMQHYFQVSHCQVRQQLLQPECPVGVRSPLIFQALCQYI